jgi:hypothetical protein
MRISSIAVVVLIGFGSNLQAQAAPSAACKQCGDYRSRCMKNYPGPTCKTDYEICIKSCVKK